jgi:hypothetical protein
MRKWFGRLLCRLGWHKSYPCELYCLRCGKNVLFHDDKITPWTEEDHIAAMKRTIDGPPQKPPVGS